MIKTLNKFACQQWCCSDNYRVMFLSTFKHRQGERGKERKKKQLQQLDYSSYYLKLTISSMNL